MGIEQQIISVFMKSFFQILALTLVLALLSSCDDNSLASGSVPVNISDVPAQATDYLQTTFTTLTIVKVEKKLNADGTVRKYEVYLSNGVEVYFDANWNPISDDSPGGDDDSFNISFSDLPQVSQDYVTQNFAGEDIKKVKKKLNDAGDVRMYEVRFESGVRLYFAPNGSFAGIDD
ncbi:MAG: hypothetical protein EAZ89_01255 [Bacteroidetes bacterium]|nr:MAG: hypothetical protein EAZ89_01255 [Bacteroidota bacterium]